MIKKPWLALSPFVFLLGLSCSQNAIATPAADAPATNTTDSDYDNNNDFDNSQDFSQDQSADAQSGTTAQPQTQASNTNYSDDDGDED